MRVRGVYETFGLRMFAVSGETFVGIFARDTRWLQDTWDALTSSETKVRDTADQVLARSDLELLTPQSKADLLDILAEDSGPVLGFGDPHREIAAEASIKILETINSHRELVEVLKRVGMENRKGRVGTLMRNYYRVIRRRLLQSEQSARTESWLRGVLDQ